MKVVFDRVLSECRAVRYSISMGCWWVEVCDQLVKMIAWTVCAVAEGGVGGKGTGRLWTREAEAVAGGVRFAVRGSSARRLGLCAW